MLRGYYIRPSALYHAHDEMAGVRGDIDTCPICYEDIDVERGEVIRMPACEHKMHPTCYAEFINYHTNQFQRQGRSVTATDSARIHSGEVVCPFCRERVVRFEPQTMVLNLRDVERTDDAIIEVLLHRREVAQNRMRQVSLALCLGFMMWMSWWIYRLTLIYDGDGISIGIDDWGNGSD
jgi:hypothetical protein